MIIVAQSNAKPAFSNSSGLKNVFMKLRFRDGSVSTVGLRTVEIKLRFHKTSSLRSA